MKTQHIILFILAMAATISLLAGIIVLFWNAFQAAKRPILYTSLASNSNFIRWTEGGALTLLAQRTMGRMNQVLTGLSAKVLPQNVLPMMDPVDGTSFQKGESIARCACGTNYHLHSWEWLMEKAEGRCVNCKSLAAPQKVIA